LVIVIVRTVVAETLVDVESTAFTVTVLVPAGVTGLDEPLALVLPPPHPKTSVAVIPSNNTDQKLLAFEICLRCLFA
jgi:hypothetical protein